MSSTATLTLCNLLQYALQACLPPVGKRPGTLQMAKTTNARLPTGRRSYGAMDGGVMMMHTNHAGMNKHCLNYLNHLILDMILTSGPI